MIKRLRKRRIATAALQAQVSIAAYPPFSMTSHRYEPTFSNEAVTAASVEASDRVSGALGRLLDHGPALDAGALVLAGDALTIARRLEYLQPSWRSHCDRTASRGASSDSRLMSREWPTEDTVQSWPFYESARQLTGVLAGLLAELQELLAEVSGRDLSRRSRPSA